MQRKQGFLCRAPRNEKRTFSRCSASRAVFSALLIITAGICPAMAQNDAGLAPLRFTLKQAVAISLQKSREISLARLQYETSRQEAGVTRSQFLPNLYTG